MWNLLRILRRSITVYTVLFHKNVLMPQTASSMYYAPVADYAPLLALVITTSLGALGCYRENQGELRVGLGLVLSRSAFEAFRQSRFRSRGYSITRTH